MTNNESTATDNHNRHGDWIQTATCRKFWPLDPRPEDVNVGDVAHALANICRFTGHTRGFYSVAQHCVIMSRVVPPGSALPALLHDAAEAYMGDIARPWKPFVRIVGADSVTLTLRQVEEKLLDVILAALKCPPRTDAAWEVIKKYDEIMLVTEARDLMSPLVDGCRHHPKDGYEMLPQLIVPWSPVRANAEFMERYAKLTQG